MNRIGLFLALTSLLVVSMTVAEEVTLKKPSLVQVRVVVSLSAWRNYLKGDPYGNQDGMRQKIYRTFREVADIYDDYDGEGSSVKFEVLEIKFINENVFKQIYPGETRVMVDSSAGIFAQWALKNMKDESYDIALLYTGMDLINNYGSSPAGHSNVNKACSPEGVAVVEFKASAGNNIIVAHELGHVLGLIHDGLAFPGYGDATQCSMQSGHLMNPNVAPLEQKHFYFSQCSIQQLKAKLADDSRKCVKDGKVENAVKGSDKQEGSDKTFDTMCSDRHGAGYKYNKKVTEKKKANPCVMVVCYNSKTRKNQWAYTQQGVSCAKNSVCRKGKCTKA